MQHARREERGAQHLGGGAKWDLDDGLADGVAHRRRAGWWRWGGERRERSGSRVGARQRLHRRRLLQPHDGEGHPTGGCDHTEAAGRRCRHRRPALLRCGARRGRQGGEPLPLLSRRRPASADHVNGTELPVRCLRLEWRGTLGATPDAVVELNCAGASGPRLSAFTAAALPGRPCHRDRDSVSAPHPRRSAMAQALPASSAVIQW